MAPSGDDAYAAPAPSGPLARGAHAVPRKPTWSVQLWPARADDLVREIERSIDDITIRIRAQPEQAFAELGEQERQLDVQFEIEPRHPAIGGLRQRLAALKARLADDGAKVARAVRLLLDEGLPDPPAWVADLPLLGPEIAQQWQALERLGANWTAELGPYLDHARDWLIQVGVRLSEALLQVTLGVFIAFFFFRDGAEGARRLSAAAECIMGSRAERPLQVAGGTVRSVVYGLIGTALAQAILQGFGLWLAGVPAALFLGFVTFFLSFIPGGPPIVWLSGAGWLLYEGAFGWSLFLAIWGLFVVSSADNVLRPYLISRGSKLPLILVLLGVLSGLVAFGVLGVFLGPTLLAVAYVLIQEWTGGAALAVPEAPAASLRISSQPFDREAEVADP